MKKFLTKKQLSQSFAVAMILTTNFWYVDAATNIQQGDGAQATGVNTIAIGTDAQSTEAQSIAIGKATVASGYNTIVLGVDSSATSKDSIAIGNESHAETNPGNIAIGVNTNSTGGAAVAIGSNSTATGPSSTAVGNTSTATGNYSIAIGNGADSTGTRSISVGDLSNANGSRSAAYGYKSNADGILSIAMGTSAQTSSVASGGIAIGTEASSTAEKGIAIGSNTLASANNTVSIGQNTKATGTFGVSMGYDASASGTASTAVGMQSTASATHASAYGYGARATGENSTALGTSAKSIGENSTAVGNSAVASGISSTAITGSATGNYAIAAGNGSTASGIRSIAIGYSARATENSSIASGNNAMASGGNSIATGTGSISSGRSSIANGLSAEASGINAISIGTNSKATELNSTSIGNASKVSGSSSLSVGNSNNVSGKNSGAIGTSNTVNTNNSYVLGNNINATQANSIILGNSSTDRAATTESSATINGLTYYKFAGQGSAANGVVSIGGEGTERQLLNVAAGKISSDSTDAINGSQLYAIANTLGNVAASTTTVFGRNAAVDGNGNITMTNIGGTGKDTIDEAIKVAKTEVEAGTNVDIATSTGDNGQTIYTINAQGTEISQGTNTHVSKSAVNELTNNITYLVSSDLATVSAGNGITLSTTATTASDGAITTNYNVKVSDDLSLNSITTGNTVINTNGLTINGDTYVSETGLNANSQKITNVANGDISATSTDAVNGSQLYKTNNLLSGKISNLDNRLNKVGAGAAALAALHPLDFDPDDKWNFAAGYGNYAGENALALGAFYRPNEDTMLSVAGSMGNGENMVNAGIALKLGQKNGVSTSRVALAKEVEDLKAIVKAQNEEIKQMKGLMNTNINANSTNKNMEFPDLPKDHWAYNYVKTLANKGLVEGYPDGNFKGDLTMTRYEFAAVIYRALQNGAPIDGNMGRAIEEFNPELERINELDRIRIDRISGKDNDRHKIDRIRINNKDNKDTNEYRDVYGSHIIP